LSQRAACRITGCARSVAQYRIRRSDDPHIRERLKGIAAERRRFGYRRLGLMLRREGIVANHKRVYRMYRDLALQLRPRRKRGVRYVRGNDVPVATNFSNRISTKTHNLKWLYERGCVEAPTKATVPDRS